MGRRIVVDKEDFLAEVRAGVRDALKNRELANNGSLSRFDYEDDDGDDDFVLNDDEDDDPLELPVVNNKLFAKDLKVFNHPVANDEDDDEDDFLDLPHYDPARFRIK